MIVTDRPTDHATLSVAVGRVCGLIIILMMMAACGVYGAGVSDPVLEQTLYVLAGLTLFILVVLVVAWRVLKGCGRRKMALLVTKQHILNSHSHDIDLKVTPIGDSTLKVTSALFYLILNST